MKEEVIRVLNMYELLQHNILIPMGDSLEQASCAVAGVISNIREKLEQLDGEPDANSQNDVDEAFLQLKTAVEGVQKAFDDMQNVIVQLQASTPVMELKADMFVGPLEEPTVEAEPIPEPIFEPITIPADDPKPIVLEDLDVDGEDE